MQIITNVPNKKFENAKSISTASLGRRITDTKRSLVGRYYSFLMYDRVLTNDEIKSNFEVNKVRYGVGTTAK